MSNQVTKSAALKIQNEFNEKAQNCGCPVRLYGTPKKPKFCEYKGEATADGYEVWWPITNHYACFLLSRYPQMN